MNKQPITSEALQSLMGAPTKTAPQASLTFHHSAAPFVWPLITPAPRPIASRISKPLVLHLLVAPEFDFRNLKSASKPRSRHPSAKHLAFGKTFPCSELRPKNSSKATTYCTRSQCKDRRKGILERKARTHALPDARHDVRRGMAVLVGGTDQCCQPVSASFLHDHV
jgi:hypothetical protein